MLRHGFDFIRLPDTTSVAPNGRTVITRVVVVSYPFPLTHVQWEMARKCGNWEGDCLPNSPGTSEVSRSGVLRDGSYYLTVSDEVVNPPPTPARKVVLDVAELEKQPPMTQEEFQRLRKAFLESFSEQTSGGHLFVAAPDYKDPQLCESCKELPLLPLPTVRDALKSMTKHGKSTT